MAKVGISTPKLIESLRKWTERNPVKQADRGYEREQMGKQRRGRSTLSN